MSDNERLIAEARRHAEALIRGTETGDADLLHDLADALEAAYDAGRRELAERFANQDRTRKAAIEELMAWEDEHEALSAHPAEEAEWAGVLPGAAHPSVGPYTERDRAERGVAAYNATRPPERHVGLEVRRKAGPWGPAPKGGE